MGYLLAPDVKRMHLRHYDANERDLLLDVQTLPNQVAPKSPHVVATEVLVLEDELDVVRAIGLLVDLAGDDNWCGRRYI